jgi:hypothetical protein
MNLYHHPRRERNHISSSIEFSNLLPEIPPATPWPQTAAGAHLHRRYFVPAGLAVLSYGVRYSLQAGCRRCNA